VATQSHSLAPARRAVHTAALAVSAVFLLVGVLGFIPGLTSSFDQLGVAGRESEAMLLGVFQVSILHNVVHLLFGAVGVAMARSIAGARSFLLFGGVVYLLLWVYGLLIESDSAANFVPLNTADNWLHLALGVGMVALALLLGRTHTTT
jgi:Domain of unknown function (DUF4383)